MKEFEVILSAVSRKTFRLRADSQREAQELVESLMENSNLLVFENRDVCSVEVSCEEQCGGVCELCGNEESCAHAGSEDETPTDGFLFSR